MYISDLRYSANSRSNFYSDLGYYGEIQFSDATGDDIRKLKSWCTATHTMDTILKMLSTKPQICGWSPKKVIFNNPATIVIWEDGSKTVVKVQNGDEFNKETGFALCCAKKMFGNKSNFNNIFKKFCEDKE